MSIPSLSDREFSMERFGGWNCWQCQLLFTFLVPIFLSLHLFSKVLGFRISVLSMMKNNTISCSFQFFLIFSLKATFTLAALQLFCNVSVLFSSHVALTNLSSLSELPYYVSDWRVPQFPQAHVHFGNNSLV